MPSVPTWLCAPGEQRTLAYGCCPVGTRAAGKRTSPAARLHDAVGRLACHAARWRRRRYACRNHRRRGRHHRGVRRRRAHGQSTGRRLSRQRQRGSHRPLPAPRSPHPATRRPTWPAGSMLPAIASPVPPPLARSASLATSKHHASPSRRAPVRWRGRARRAASRLGKPQLECKRSEGQAMSGVIVTKRGQADGRA